MIDLGSLEDILELEGIEEFREKNLDHYLYKNQGVPRVTHIIKECTNSDALINWASRVGFKMKNIRDKATTVGTITHSKIENYMNYLLVNPSLDEDLYDNQEDYIPDAYCREINTAYNNFKYWMTKINNMGVYIQELKGCEITVTTPWFGGTIDAIVKINGAWYIIDFKTSSKISTSYLIQTASYMWAINNGYCPGMPHIDGIGIIRVDKKTRGKFEDLFLNEFDPIQNGYIYSYQQCFLAYLNVYYRNIHTEYITNNFRKEYDTKLILSKGE